MLRAYLILVLPDLAALSFGLLDPCSDETGRSLFNLRLVHPETHTSFQIAAGNPERGQLQTATLSDRALAKHWRMRSWRLEWP